MPRNLRRGRGGAREQDTFQRDGAQNASMQAGEDDREIGGTETRRDGGEARACGAMGESVGEVTAIARQDVNGA